jgi:hypothetical protein
MYSGTVGAIFKIPYAQLVSTLDTYRPMYTGTIESIFKIPYAHLVSTLDTFWNV